jgi:hypothetical protein
MYYFSLFIVPNIVTIQLIYEIKFYFFLLLSCDIFISMSFIIYLFIFGNMNSSLNKSNLHFEIITIKIVVIHTNSNNGC